LEWVVGSVWLTVVTSESLEHGALDLAGRGEPCRWFRGSWRAIVPGDWVVGGADTGRRTGPRVRLVWPVLKNRISSTRLVVWPVISSDVAASSSLGRLEQDGRPVVHGVLDEMRRTAPRGL